MNKVVSPLKIISLAITPLLLLLGVSGQSWAAIIKFESRTSFNEAIDEQFPSLIKGVEGWDNVPAGTIIPNGTTFNDIKYTLTRGDAIVSSGGIPVSPPNDLFFTNAGLPFPDDFLPTRDTITFSFEQSITAFGISFNTFATQTGDYTITTNLGDVAPSFFDPSFPGATTGAFAGLISDTPFNAVTIDAIAFARYGLDDLTFARPVPEPRSMVGSLTALGLGVLFQRKFSQKKQRKPDS